MAGNTLNKSEATASSDAWTPVAICGSGGGVTTGPAGQLAICAMVRAAPTAAGGHFQLIRSSNDAQVFLGCIADRSGKPVERVELWLPVAADIADPLIADDHSLTAEARNDRWRRVVESVADAQPESLIRTGTELSDHFPVNIDLSVLPGGTTGAKTIWNPTGGPIMVRRALDVPIVRYLDWINSGHDPEDPVGNHSNAHWMFLGTQGRAGRLTEALHLKLRLIASAIISVRDSVKAGGRPLLNVSEHSFGLTLSDENIGLPRLWTAQTRYADIGAANAYSIADSDEKFFLPALGSGESIGSIYSPHRMQAGHGRAAMRIRDIATDAAGKTILTGTFATHENLSGLSTRDLVRMRVTLGQSLLHLYARLEGNKALAASEWRFRTVARKFTWEEAARLRGAAGVSLTNVLFDHLPVLNSPADLNALGVLAVRAILVNRETALPAALDDILSLAKQVTTELQGDESIDLTIGRIMSSNPKWLAALGPHRLLDRDDDNIEASEINELVPAVLWSQVLAAIIRMFPALGKFSHASDYADAPADGIHRVFDAAISDFNTLVVRSRSLIVIDWRYNREVHSVIRQFAMGLAQVKARTDALAQQDNSADARAPVSPQRKPPGAAVASALESVESKAVHSASLPVAASAGRVSKSAKEISG